MVDQPEAGTHGASHLDIVRRQLGVIDRWVVTSRCATAASLGQVVNDILVSGRRFTVGRYTSSEILLLNLTATLIIWNRDSAFASGFLVGEWDVRKAGYSRHLTRTRVTR